MPRASNLHISIAVALAACAFALPAMVDGDTVEIQLTPAGDFRPSDGREMKVTHWHIDAASAARVIARNAARANPRVIDYEHQTLHKESNGQPAPAAGWIRDLVWREGQGLFATVELTARAKRHIRHGEYKFLSPVFGYDGRTGEVLSIEMAALTNHAAIDGMQPLELRAAATFGAGIIDEDPSMNKLLLALCTALALNAESTTEDQAIAALTARLQADPLADVRKALGVADDAQPEALVAACTAMKTKAESAKPNPAEFVAVATFEDVKSQLATLTAKLNGRDVAELVERGLAEGRLLPAQKAWAEDLGKSDIAALTAYLTATAPIAALSGSQTQGRPPEKSDSNPHALTTDELAVCTATGVDPKDFAAAKAA